MRIIVDAMGGDYAPDEIVLGALDAAMELNVEITLVGRGEEILKCLKARGCKGGYRSVFLMLVDRADGVYLVQKS